MNNNNKRLDDKSKLIMVTGIKGVDTLISVYNQEGIKAASQLDNKLVYTYELLIDLKKLGLSANYASKFAYNIKLAGVDAGAVFKESGVQFINNGTSGEIIIDPGFKNFAKPNLPQKVNVDVFESPTDFWGEYTLAKK
jgi:hypothetical protein